MRMTLADAVKKAVAEQNAPLVGRIAEKLRVRGLNYQQSYELVNSIQPIGLAEWDALLYESEVYP
jgi:hypothetical protein